jgi:hypothetical protein
MSFAYTGLVLITLAGLESSKLGALNNVPEQGTYVYLKGVTEEEKIVIEHKVLLRQKAAELEREYMFDKYGYAMKNIKY